MAYSQRLEIVRIAKQYSLTGPVFLDTETTGLGNLDEIVEISLVNHDGMVLLDTLVKPTRLIPGDAIWVHGITNDMVREAPAWPDVWQAVDAVLQGRLVGIYNAEFDLRMMRQSHSAHGLPWLGDSFRSFCIMKLYASFYGGSGYGSRAGQGRYQKLEQAARQCGLQVGDTHRALDDSLLAMGVFGYLASRSG